MKRYLYILTIFLTGFAYGQDRHFSQFYNSPLNLNPALCGSFRGDIYSSINYRSQWATAMGSGYNTMCATVAFQNIAKKWHKAFLSPGIVVYNDKSGDGSFATPQVNLTIASGIFISRRSCITAGIQGGWAQRTISTTKMQWGNQYVNGDYDPNAPSGEPALKNTKSYIDFASGVSYSYGKGQVSFGGNDEIKANIGAAVYHINQPNISVYGQSGNGDKLYMRYGLHGSLLVGIPNTLIAVAPAFMWFKQGSSNEINVGAKLRYYLIHFESRYTGANRATIIDFGAYYRFNDAMIVTAGFEIASFAIGLSYDINTSSLAGATKHNGAFEISLRYINHKLFNNRQTSTPISIF